VTLKIAKTPGGFCELKCLFARTGAKRNVVLVISSLGNGHEGGRREDRSWIADAEANSSFVIESLSACASPRTEEFPQPSCSFVTDSASIAELFFVSLILTRWIREQGTKLGGRNHTSFSALISGLLSTFVHSSRANVLRIYEYRTTRKKSFSR